MPLILAALAAVPLVVFLPKLKSQIAALSGGAAKGAGPAASPAGFASGSEEPEYPARMELLNAQGKNLKVVLLSRSATKIRFLRESDRSEHIYPIRSLDPLSRKRVEAYPVTGIDLRQSSVAAEQLSREEIHIEQLREENRRLKHEIDLLKLKENETNRHDTKLRLADLEARIKKNELRILKREQPF